VFKIGDIIEWRLRGAWCGSDKEGIFLFWSESEIYETNTAHGTLTRSMIYYTPLLNILPDYVKIVEE